MKKNIVFNCIMFSLLFSGCGKYLNEKSDKSLATLSTLADMQSLLDNNNYIQTLFASAGEVSANDFYLTDDIFNALSNEEDKRMYTWQPSNLFVPYPAQNEWETCFEAINYCNTVLYYLPGITGSDSEEGRNIKGQALVWRAFRFLDAAQIWCQPYDSTTASSMLGLPLRLDPDFNKISIRTSLKDTYQQIINDLKEGISLLPNISTSIFRPSKAAAFGLLSRTLLSAHNYKGAGLYADSCLQIANELIDYNTLTTTKTYPISRSNSENILIGFMFASSPISNSNQRIDSMLYRQYNDNDLRKLVFFYKNADGSYRFKGNYTGESGKFVGIAVDEMYLIRAECYARAGKIAEAVADLNTLISKRWKNGTFIPFTAFTSEEALILILTERRKELLMRGLRWMDIKRLNHEGANIELARTINGTQYTLPPDDLRYALPLPEDVIALSGMQQNSR